MAVALPFLHSACIRYPGAILSAWRLGKALLPTDPALMTSREVQVLNTDLLPSDDSRPIVCGRGNG